jgi:pilus assembly protein Flp/PilA
MSGLRAAPAPGPTRLPRAQRCAYQVASRFVLAQCRLAEALRLNDRGGTAIEYGLIAGFIAAVIAGAVALLGAKVSAMFTNFVNAF